MPLSYLSRQKQALLSVLMHPNGRFRSTERFPAVEPIQTDMYTVQTGRFPPNVLAPARIHSVYTESGLIEGIGAVHVVQTDVFIWKE